MMCEDFLVVGHGAIERQNLRNGQPYRLYPLDAARLAFNSEWDGSDPDWPRYAYLEDYTSDNIEYWMLDRHAMVLVNTERSYDILGLSHVEVLDQKIRALLEGDDYLLSQVQQSAPNGALYLGRQAGKEKIEDLRQQISAVKRAFVILGGTEDPKYIPFSATARELQVLESQEWFVRQVAAIFGIPTSMLALAVDTSRANTEAMLDNALEALIVMLTIFRDMENSQLVRSYGPLEEINLMIEYPILSQKDELQQAQINQTQLAGMAWASINEARRASGLEQLDDEIANEILVDNGTDGLVPLSILLTKWRDMLQSGQVQIPAQEKATILHEAKKQKENKPFKSYRPVSVTSRSHSSN
jgi:hypothetical protein